jgi:hypothetical protein
LIVCFSDAAGFYLHSFRRHQQSLILPVVCRVKLSTSSLTDARRIKPGGGSITLYQSPGKLFNFGLFY